MEFCFLCERPCITENHYKVVDVKNNKMTKESILCQRCGLTYVESVFRKSEPEKFEPPEKPKTIHIIKTPEELLSVMMGMGIVTKPPEKPKLEGTCEKCELEINEFIKKGRFGCPECYTQFKETFLAMADTFQNGGTKHIGKQPKNYTNIKEKDNIDNLKKKMSEAIKEENYEKAALIRDQIKFMENQKN